MPHPPSENARLAVPPGFHMLDWRSGFGDSIGPIFERTLEDGGYVRAFRVEPRHTNGLNNAHGGMLLSFADMAFGHVVSARRERWWVTVRLSCDFLAPAHLGDWVEGSGEILGVQDDYYTVEGRLWVGERTVLTGLGLFKALSRRE